MDTFNESLEELYRISRRWTIPCAIAKIFRIKPGKAVLYFMSFLFLLMIFGIHDKLICDLITFVFPARWTLISISNPNFSSDKLWVTYWIIYSLLKIIDEVFPFFLQFIPFFYAIKSFFLLLMCAPKIEGAIIIHNTLLVQLMKELKKLRLPNK